MPCGNSCQSLPLHCISAVTTTIPLSSFCLCCCTFTLSPHLMLSFFCCCLPLVCCFSLVVHKHSRQLHLLCTAIIQLALPGPCFLCCIVVAALVGCWLLLGACCVVCSLLLVSCCSFLVSCFLLLVLLLFVIDVITHVVGGRYHMKAIIPITIWLAGFGYHIPYILGGIVA